MWWAAWLGGQSTDRAREVPTGTAHVGRGGDHSGRLLTSREVSAVRVEPGCSESEKEVRKIEQEKTRRDPVMLD